MDGIYVAPADIPPRNDGWADETGRDPLDFSDMTEADIDGMDDVVEAWEETERTGSMQPMNEWFLRTMGTAVRTSEDKPLNEL